LTTSPRTNLLEVSAESVRINMFKMFQFVVFDEKPVRKRFLRHVNLVLLHRGQPLRQNVRVGQAGVGHRRYKEHGTVGNPQVLHLHGEALEQVVHDARGIARDQNVAAPAQRQPHHDAQHPQHGVGIADRGLGEVCHYQDVGVFDRVVVHGTRVGGQSARPTQIDDLLVVRRNDPVGGAEAKTGTRRHHLQSSIHVLTDTKFNNCTNLH
jgi:hypothetical protein